MGGCRCSYRNCSVRSDGMTHMFHYPVFDKIRCHQWLTNAHKLEFLNLKVSQLKNRVICQNHFRDEWFMNFKKDKLKFDAVPTLDGPYCDSSQYDSKSSELLKIYPISLDDIENEYLTFTEKQANSSVKYGDFLTNFDMMDVDFINNTDNNAQAITKKNSNFKVQPQPIQNNNNKELPVVNVKTELSSKVKPKSELSSAKPPLSSRIQFEDVRSSSLPILAKNNDLNNLKTSKDWKVRILSEQKISKPVKIIGKLKPLPASSLIIRVPANKNKANITSLEVNESENKSNCNNEMPLKRALDDSSSLVQPEEELPTSTNQTLQVSDSVIQDNPQKKIKIDIKNNSILSSKLSKNKVNPERVAAIKEKRKFNMKLKDIIESCLDKVDKKYENDNSNSKMQQHKNMQVDTFLSQDPELPSLQAYTIACLQARIEKMENLLLNKIERNSQRIVDLKNSLNTSDNKLKCTQTLKNEELHKRQLYKEISQYLSPNTKSLVYEELFINKYAHNVSKSSPLQKKRRKKGYIKKIASGKAKIC